MRRYSYDHQPDLGSRFGTFELSDERLAFIRRVYTWFAASILIAVGAGMAATMSKDVAAWALANRGLLWGTEFAFILLSYFLRDRHPFNIGLLLGFAVVTGLSLGAVALVLGAQGQGHVMGQAGLVTMMTFSGLTFYAFTTRREFSFMRGFLVSGMWGVFGVGMAAMVFGFGGNGLWFVLSCVGALVGAGFILYDTQNIIHHYEEGEEVGAAFNLYWAVWYLFWNLIQIFLLSRD